MADTPEDSDHTSIQQRIKRARKGEIPVDLMRFRGNERKDQLAGIPFALEHYIELVVWTGKITRTNKRSNITSDLPPILECFGIGEETRLILAREFEESFSQWFGSEAAIRRATRNVGKTRSRSPPIPAG